MPDRSATPGRRTRPTVWEAVNFRWTAARPTKDRVLRSLRRTGRAPQGGERSCSRGCADADRTADAGTAEAAVAAGVLREVLLVVLLGVVKLRRRQDFGRDASETGGGQPLLERVARPLGGALLDVTVGVNPRTVLGADVVALAHALGRIVILPEHLQEIVVRDPLRIEHDQDDFGMSGHARADFPVRRIRRRPG